MPCWLWCMRLYIRCPKLREGVYLLLWVLAEFPGDFSGLRQLLCQVCLDVIWQLLVRGGYWRQWNLKNLDKKFKGKRRRWEKKKNWKELAWKKCENKDNKIYTEHLRFFFFSLQRWQSFSLIFITNGCGPTGLLRNRHTVSSQLNSDTKNLMYHIMSQILKDQIFFHCHLWNSDRVLSHW